jgi:hypothetical protein
LFEWPTAFVFQAARFLRNFAQNADKLFPINALFCPGPRSAGAIKSCQRFYCQTNLWAFSTQRISCGRIGSKTVPMIFAKAPLPVDRMDEKQGKNMMLLRSGGDRTARSRFTSRLVSLYEGEQCRYDFSRLLRM